MIERTPQEEILEGFFMLDLGFNQSRRCRGDFAFSRLEPDLPVYYTAMFTKKDLLPN